jgi:hypothetical protein
LDVISLPYRLLALQNIHASQKESELRELVITGLAHLVTANSESGFKQCLPLAYDHDTRKRMIFAHVFARVIGEGTVFDPEDKSLTKARHTSICEVSFDAIVIHPLDSHSFSIAGQRFRCKFNQLFYRAAKIYVGLVGTCNYDLRGLSTRRSGADNICPSQCLRLSSIFVGTHQAHD